MKTNEIKKTASGEKSRLAFLAAWRLNQKFRHGG
jgi:hypothetical protein